MVDTALLIVLPIVLGLTALAFVRFAIHMARQDAYTFVGIHLWRMFVSLACAFAVLTVLFTVFAFRWHRADLTNWVWFMAPLAVFLGLSAWHGAAVMRAERALTRQLHSENGGMA